MTTQTDSLDIQLRVLKAEEAKRDLEAAEAAVSSMGDAAKRAALDAGKAQERWSEYIDGTKRRQNELRTTIFQTIEIGNRVIGMLRTFGAAVSEIASRNTELRDALEDARLAADGLVNQFAAGAASGGNFAAACNSITSGLDNMGSAARTAGRWVDELIGLWNQQREGGNDLLGFLISSTGLLGAGVNYLRGADDRAAAEAAAAAQEAAVQRALAGLRGTGRGNEMSGDEDYLAGLDYQARLEEGIAAQRQQEEAYRRALAEGDVIRGVKGASGGGGAEAERAAREEERQFYDDIIGVQTTMAENDEAIAEARLQDIRSQSEAMTELNRQAQERADLELNAHEARVTMIEMEKEANRQYHEELRATILETISASASVMQTGASVFGQLAAQQQQQISNITSALKASGASQAQIAKAVEAHEVRLDRLRKAEGGLLIAYNAVMAATAIAEAIESGAKQDYGAAVAHAAAAAAYVAAGAMAAVKLGSDDGSAASASAAPTTSYVAPTREKREETGDKRPGGGRLQLVVMGSSDPDLVGITERAEWQFERGGYDRPARGLGFYG